MKTEQSIVNSEVLRGFNDYVCGLGLNSKALYQQFGVSAKLIADKNIKLPFSIVAGLLQSAAKHSQHEDFALRFAAAQRRQQILKTPPKFDQFDSFHSALVAAMKHYNLPGSEINWSLEAIGDKAYLTRLERLDPKVDSRHYTSLVIARCLTGLQELFGANWRPHEVLFSFQAPKDPRPYQRYFCSAIQFDQEHTQIIFPSKVLTPALSPVPHIEQNPTENNPADFHHDADKFLAHVNALVRQALHNGHCQPQVVAGLLSLNSKKLQRMLQKLGTNFQDIRHQVRLDEAAYYLNNSTISITYIAEILGYSEAGALSRAFKRKHGKSPSAWRQSQRRRLQTKHPAL